MNPDFEAREYFLILLLKEISRRLSGKPFSVKGGICLRFFYQSPHLSEDMDLDIAQVPPFVLRDIIEKILNSRSLNAVLENRTIRISKWTAPKQTATTQRWKIGLLVNNRLLSTKLEFSRRKTEVPFISGIPDNNLLSHHKIMAFVTQYYSLEEMIIQKIMALASPTRAAARDLFDLYFLINSHTKELGVGINKKAGGKIKLPPKIIAAAAEKCKIIGRSSFKTQVVPFLPEDLALFFMESDNVKKLQEQIEIFLKED